MPSRKYTYEKTIHSMAHLIGNIPYLLAVSLRSIPEQGA